MKRAMLLFSVMLFGSLLLLERAFAAEVTVNPAGGGNYTTLFDAVDQYGAWATASTTNTIILVDGKHAIDLQPNLPDSLQGALVIKADSGAKPVLVNGEFLPDMVDVSTAGKVVLDGLTMINSNGRTTGRVLWVHQNSGALDLTVRNCVFTANNGSDQAITNYAAYYGARPTTGIWTTAIRFDSTPTAGVRFNSENNVVAFTSDSAVSVAMDLSTYAATSGFDFTGSLFYLCGVGQDVLRFMSSVQNGVKINFKKSAIIGQSGVAAGDGFRLGNSAASPLLATFNLEDSLIYEIQNRPLRIEEFAGTMTLNRCTIYTSNNDAIALSGSAANLGRYHFKDSIFKVGDSLFRVTTSGIPALFTTMTLQNVVVVGPCFRDTQNVLTKQVFLSQNNGAGPWRVDPLFVQTSITSSTFNNVTHWNAVANNFLDVGASFYLDKSSAGGALTGATQTGTTSLPVVAGTGGTLNEQFSVIYASWIQDNRTTLTEVKAISRFAPTLTTTGWGGYYAGPDRAIRVQTGSSSGSWNSDLGRSGYLNISEPASGSAAGSYFYCQLTTDTIRNLDLSTANAKIEWDANLSTTNTIQMRVMLKTPANGWIISSPISGQPLIRTWTVANVTPPFSVLVSSLTWNSIANALQTPKPDLDGLDSGPYNDSGPLVLGAAVTPDLSSVSGFGLMLASSIAGMNDLRLDAIRITGGFTSLSGAENWNIYE
jgi:hypothetical protein